MKYISWETVDKVKDVFMLTGQERWHCQHMGPLVDIYFYKTTLPATL